MLGGRGISPNKDVNSGGCHDSTSIHLQTFSYSNTSIQWIARSTSASVYTDVGDRCSKLDVFAQDLTRVGQEKVWLEGEHPWLPLHVKNTYAHNLCFALHCFFDSCC